MERKKYEYNGLLLTIQDVADMSVASYCVVRNRLQSGWSVEDTIKTPALEKHRKNPVSKTYKCVYNGKTMGVSELARALGVKKDTIYHRLVRGATLQEVADNPRPNERKYIFYGVEYDLTEAADLAGISRNSFSARFRAGESAESIILSGNRCAKKYPYKGKLHTLRELLSLPECESMSIHTLKGRICIYGWSVEKALRTPVTSKDKAYFYQGRSFRLSELANLPECAVSMQTLQSRLRNHWSVEEALKTPAKYGNRTRKQESK